MSPQDSSRRPIQDFLAHLNSVRKYCSGDAVSGVSTEYFIPRQDIIAYLDNNILCIAHILKALFPNEELPVRPDFVAEKCLVSFCILLKRGIGKYIQHFCEHQSLWDESLPFRNLPAEFPEVTGDGEFWEDFRTEQWHFCAAELPRSHSVDYEEDYILPFMEKERLKVATKGLTASMYKVKVHSQYDRMRYPDEKIEGHRTLVLKTYRGKRASQYYHTEVQNFDKLCLRNPEAAPGLIRFYCGFTHRKTYNLLLEYANEGTLEDLFQKGDAPSSGAEISIFWKAFLECIKALVNIHELNLHLGGSEVLEVLQGWHQDVKPSNILVHSHNVERYDSYQFRLADLGLSHFTRMTSSEDPNAIDTLGTRAYGAPEIHRRSDFDAVRIFKSKRSVDIWSLGCVMLEICVWICRGRRYLNDFRRRREHENSQSGSSASDCFHNGHLPNPSVLATVRDEPDRLLDDKRESDFLTPRILEIVKRMVRPNPRSSADNILADMENAIEAADRDSQRHYIDRLSAYGRSASELQSPRTPPNSGSPRGDYSLHGIHNAGSPGRSGSVTNGRWSSGGSTSPSWPKAPIHQPPVTTTQTTSGHSGHRDFGHLSEALSGAANGRSGGPGGIPAESPIVDPIKRSDTFPQSSNSSTHQKNWPYGRSPGAEVREHRARAPHLFLDEALEWRRGGIIKKAIGANRLPNIEKFRSWFDNRDHIFLIDDSQSMEPFKDHIVMLLDPLAYIVKKGDPDGIELFYTVSPANLKNKNSSKITQHLSSHRFQGETDIGARLHTILQERQVALKKQSMARPASVYIFTDGVWARGKDAKTPIREMINVLKQKRCTRKQIGIQFISYGDDREGLARLDELDEFGKHPEINFDIVDTEGHDGNLLKMLLGPIDKTFDDVYVD